MQPLKFQKNCGYEAPVEVLNWQWSDTFGRWGAVVRFANEPNPIYTWPQDVHHPDVPHRATSEEIKAQLLDALRVHVKDFRKPWPGCEFAKTIIGNAIIGAAREHGATDREISDAMLARHNSPA